MSKASEQKLSALHGHVADALITSIGQADLAVVLLAKHPDLPAGVKTFLENCSDVHPSLLTVATKFLKDNHISVDGEDSTELGELEKQLKDNRKKSKINDISIQ